MITKDKVLDWREHEVTKKLLFLLNMGEEEALQMLISDRQNNPDFYRGSIMTYREVKDIITSKNSLLLEEIV